MKLLTHICRVLVGVLFIISGLIKLNDPVGFSFKLEEYFNADVLNMEFLIPYALAIAVGIVIFEVLLGVMLLVGFKRNFTVWSLLLMIAFFTFLTFYSAYFNKVTDCGCFGDALKLTPWQSFTKDVVLLAMILILFFNKNLIKPIGPKGIVNAAVLVSLVGCCFMGWWVLNHLPLVDFRAYKVGTNIREGMTIPDGAARSEYEIVFIYNVNGQQKEFTDKQLGEIPQDAQFIDRKDKLIKQGYVAPIHDFTIEKDGEDYTDAMLDEHRLVMIVSYDLTKADDEGLDKIANFAKDADAKGYTVIGMTASPADIIEMKKQEHNLPFDFYFCDATTLKTIERANPSIVVLNNGTITQKAHYNDTEGVKL